jgi:predicted transcriptional regulator
MIPQHVPPSRRRYEASHPTLSVRLSAEDKKRILNIARKSKRSISQIIKEALGLMTKDTDEIYENGYDNGFDDGWEEGSIMKLPCMKCRKEMELDIHDVKIKEAIKKAFITWHHVECPGN